MQDDGMPGAAAHLSIMFADISGSTLMYAVRGDSVAFSLTSTCLTLMEEQVKSVGGRVVKRVGDGIMAVFETTEAAVSAAVGIQEALDKPGSELRREGLHVRVGVACGRSVLAGGDVYGDVVNVAARLQAHAGP